MTIETRIYGGGAIAFGGQAAIDDLLAAGYSAVIIWSVHVAADGSLALNDTQIVNDGVYSEALEMDLPPRLAQLRKAGVQIIFSVGAGGVDDFQHIGNLLSNGYNPGNPLYRNFKALREAMISAGGDIDAIDFDNEDDWQASIMVEFGSMLHDVGFASVTFCPYFESQFWTDTYTQLRQKYGKAFVSAIHLQCYSGGRGQTPNAWGQIIADNGGGTLLIPGLATNQAGPGPWWHSGKPGSSVVKTTNVAMDGNADWSGLLRRGNYGSANAAMQDTRGGETFFFFCRGYLDLGPGRQFQPGDAAFFAGVPWWAAAPQCEAYSLSGGCSNTYNQGGACPSDLQSQYASWKKEKNPPDGGFVWLYDSVVNCLLSCCCGGTERTPATTAKRYRQAITNGLT